MMKLHRLCRGLLSGRLPMLLAGVLVASGGTAWAQIRLPSLPSRPLGVVIQLPATAQATQRTLDSALAPADLAALRGLHIDALLRQHPAALQREPGGEAVVRGELLALPSSAPLRERLLRDGYQLLREQVLDGLDERWLILRPPAGMALPAALARLRELDPAGEYDYHHLYTGSSAPAATATATATATASANTSASASTNAGSSVAVPSDSRPPPAALRVGLIDGGIDVRHPALAQAAFSHWGCDGQAHPSTHGTAVASLLVGRDQPFRGAQPAAALWAADVYCDAPTGGSVEAIAQALAWMAREQIAVVNISLVGPPNRLLERAVAALVSRGHLLVAAVGNDGPAAPPLYPAAWPGVVGVTATDARRRLLPEASRGPHVAFAAPGADMAAASRGPTRYEAVRGTSFAAPLVAGLLAATLQRPERNAAASALAALGAQAIDLGASGRDPLYGWGLVGDALRADLQLAQLNGTH